MERRLVWIGNFDTEKVRERQIGSFLNEKLAKYGEDQLEISQDQQIFVNIKKKAFKHCIGKQWLGYILRGESLVKKVIKGQMEEKREKPRIMLLEDIKINDTYEMIKRRALYRESGRHWMPRTYFRAEHQ